MSMCKGDKSCSKCLEVFSTSRQLPCLHSFCECCLRDYLTKRDITTVGPFIEFMCPVCRAVTILENNDKRVRKRDPVLVQNPVSLVTDSKAKIERSCNTCPQVTNPATKFCVSCEEFMCENCSKCHQKMKMSRQHQLVTVDKMESDPNSLVGFVEGLRCVEHNDKENEFYCTTHSSACCVKCSFLYHRTCDEVLELNANVTNLLKDINPPKIMEEMLKLQGHLSTFLDRNKANISSLKSQVNNISTEIGKVRNKINAMLNDVEKLAQSEGNKIYKAEMIKIKELSRQCQSFISAIRNSHALLETASRHGTDTQQFMVASKTMKQVQAYKSQIQENFVRVDSIKLILQFDSHLNAVLSQDGNELVKVVCKEEKEILQSASTFIPLRERMVELSRIINVNCPNGNNPYYRGIAHLHGGEIVLADTNNNTCCLYDSSYNFITMSALPSSPYDICLIDDNEVAVTMPLQNTVQFLSIKDHLFKDTARVTTRYECDGVATANKMEIVVAGHCGDNDLGTKCYWSLISKDGKENFHHEFDCPRTTQAYIALNTSKSRVYISVCGGHVVYCFGLMDRRHYFMYKANNLTYPLGVAVDMEDNIYVVGCHSDNIHKLAPDGTILQVVSSGIPNKPSRISFNANQDQFILTNNSKCKSLYYFTHK